VRGGGVLLTLRQQWLGHGIARELLQFGGPFLQLLSASADRSCDSRHRDTRSRYGGRAERGARNGCYRVRGLRQIRK